MTESKGLDRGLIVTGKGTIKEKPRSPAWGNRRLMEPLTKIVNQVGERSGEAGELGLRC